MAARIQFVVTVAFAVPLLLSSSSNHLPTNVEAFAAASNSKKGFGNQKGGATAKRNIKSRGFGASAGGSAKKKRQRAQLWEMETVTPEVEPQKSEMDTPVLDKWGLPPPTLDDIFPPLGPEVERIPGTTTSLAKIRQAVERFVPLDLSCFDDEGRFGAMQLQLVHQSPPVLVLDNFLTRTECEAIAAVAGLGDDSPSNDVHKFPPHKIGSAQFSDTAVTQRTSTSWFCHYASVPTLLAKLEYVLGWDSATLEEPQIVSYQPGQQFTWHYDEVPRASLNNGGQRLATFLVYLNDVLDGGATMFRDLTDDGTPLQVQPVTGRALLFFPALADGTPDERTLHQGTPAPSAEKRIVQVWNHAQTYRAVVPPQNRQADASDAVAAEKERLGYTTTG